MSNAEFTKLFAKVFFESLAKKAKQERDRAVLGKFLDLIIRELQSQGGCGNCDACRAKRNPAPKVLAWAVVAEGYQPIPVSTWFEADLLKIRFKTVGVNVVVRELIDKSDYDTLQSLSTRTKH